MKTKRAHMSARFTKECSNAVNRSGEKETINHIMVIDKKTEKKIVDARIYMGSSRNASTVYCSIWVQVKETKKPKDWQYGYTSGSGSAGGYGYHKSSQALADAISSAGIQLLGSPYNRDHVDENKPGRRANIGGCGDSAMRDAVLAIAYASGYSDCILVD